MVYDAASVSAKISLVLSEWSRALASCQIRWLSYGAGKDLMRFSWWGRIRQNGWHLQIRCLVVVWKDPMLFGGGWFGLLKLFPSMLFYVDWLW